VLENDNDFLDFITVTMFTKFSLRKSEMSHLFEFLRSKFFPLFIPILVIYIFLQIKRRFAHKTTGKVVALYIYIYIYIYADH
jgi:hypothetical protein